MNFDNCAIYVERALAGDPDPGATLALSLTAWFFDEALKTVQEFDEVERDLQLMSAPMACADLCRLVVMSLAETVNESLEMSDDEPYDGRFDIEASDDFEPGHLQAYQIADICFSVHEVKPSEYPEYAKQIAMLLIGLADTFVSPDMKTISLSLVGMIPETLDRDQQSKLADAIMQLFHDHSIPLENSVLNFFQLNNDMEETK